MTSIFEKVMALDDAVNDITDGAKVLCGGFGGAGYPSLLVGALAARRVRGLTMIANNVGYGPLLEYGGVCKIVCSYPLGPTSRSFLKLLERDAVTLELEPQGSLVERLRAGGAGVAGVLTQVGLAAELRPDREYVTVDGERFVLLRPLRGDFALIKAWRADPLGNLIYRHAGRNFNPIMARAAHTVIVEAEEIVGVGELDPDSIHTPGAFVDRVVEAG